MTLLILLLLAADPEGAAPDSAELQDRLERMRIVQGACVRTFQRADGGWVEVQPPAYAATPGGAVVPYDPDNPPLLHYAFALSVDGCPIPVVNPSSRRAPEDYIRELPLGEVRPSR